MPVQVRQHQSEQRAAITEDSAFGQKLAHQAAAAGAKCGAHGDFGLAGLGARQQEIRYVRSGDQQHEDDGGHKNQERFADVAKRLLFEGGDLHAASFVGGGIGAFQAFGDGVHVGLGPRGGDSGLEARQNQEAAIAAFVQIAGAAGHDEGHPYFRLAGEAAETPGGDADHGEWLAV